MMARVIRWICEKCDKRWIHPVERCLYCGDSIKKQVGKETKVIGNTKVNIPNPLHPVIPYNVLILQDEFGNKMPKKTMKDYKIGDIYEDKPDPGANAVSAVKIKYDYYEAVDEALDLIGGIEVSPEKKILIKPNLSIPGYSFLGMCTNPKVIAALIEVLLKKGASKENIKIAEQSFFMPTEKAVSKTGISKVMKKYGVGFIDLAQTEFEKKEMREFSVELTKILSDFDIVFNMPVIKTDMVLGLDGAFENLIRFLSKDTFESLAKDQKKAALALAALPGIIPSFITLSDASIGLQGNGPAQHGEPGFYSMVFASRNPVVHDRAVQEVLCLRKLPYVELASQLGYGEYDINKINFVGNELDALRRDIKQPIGSKLIKNA